MKNAWRFAYGAVVLLVCLLGIVAPACSSDDSATGIPNDDASTGSPDAGLCVLEGAYAGGPCYPVGPTLCFQECATGGCICTKDIVHPGADAGVWVCQSDTTCLPDAPPVDFDAVSPPFDAGDDADDGSDDSATDDAGDDAD